MSSRLPWMHIRGLLISWTTTLISSSNMYELVFIEVFFCIELFWRIFSNDFCFSIFLTSLLFIVLLKFWITFSDARDTLPKSTLGIWMLGLKIFCVPSSKGITPIAYCEFFFWSLKYCKDTTSLFSDILIRLLDGFPTFESESIRASFFILKLIVLIPFAWPEMLQIVIELLNLDTVVRTSPNISNLFSSTTISCLISISVISVRISGIESPIESAFFSSK